MEKETTDSYSHLNALDFRLQAGSIALKDELQKAEDIRIFLEKNRQNMIPHNLPTHLLLLLKQKGLRRSKVAQDSLLDRKYVYQIFSGEKTPSRDKLIALAFGLHLSADETQTMLKVSGNRELYVRDERDAIILYAFHRGMPISNANELLFDYDLKLLGSID